MRVMQKQNVEEREKDEKDGGRKKGRESGETKLKCVCIFTRTYISSYKFNLIYS